MRGPGAAGAGPAQRGPRCPLPRPARLGAPMPGAAAGAATALTRAGARAGRPAGRTGASGAGSGRGSGRTPRRPPPLQYRRERGRCPYGPGRGAAGPPPGHGQPPQPLNLTPAAPAPSASLAGMCSPHSWCPARPSCPLPPDTCRAGPWQDTYPCPWSSRGGRAGPVRDRSQLSALLRPHCPVPPARSAAQRVWAGAGSSWSPPGLARTARHCPSALQVPFSGGGGAVRARAGAEGPEPGL